MCSRHQTYITATTRCCCSTLTAYSPEAPALLVQAVTNVVLTLVCQCLLAKDKDKATDETRQCVGCFIKVVVVCGVTAAHSWHVVCVCVWVGVHCCCVLLYRAACSALAAVLQFAAPNMSRQVCRVDALLCGRHSRC